MMRIALTALLGSSLATVAAAAVLSLSSRAGFTGVGPIVFGTTPAQATATGTRFVATKPAPGSTCYYLRGAELPGVSFMVENGTIRRVEIVSGAIRTTDGFGVGDAVARLEAFYGRRMRVASDKYDPQTQTMSVVPKDVADAKYRMIYRVKAGLVNAIITGVTPQIDYVEGCS